MIRIRAWVDQWRESLFFVPMIYVLGSIAFAEATLAIDRDVMNGAVVPFLLDATVDSARIILSTIAGATITVASLAFSISLLLIQLASAQFSPRVLRGFFRDPVSKRAMGLAAGTFAYCLFILRVVRVPGDGGPEVVPYLSILVALVFGVITVLTILHFISHSAHSMQAGEIIRRIMDETDQQLARICSERGTVAYLPTPPEPSTPGTLLLTASSGWIQQIDFDRLEELCEPGGLIRVEVQVGNWITTGAPLCMVWPPPDDERREDIERCFLPGRGRTMQQDLAFGIRQLVDIGLRALSPGINDPTTAQEVIVHLGVVTRRLLTSDLPPAVRPTENGGTVHLRELYDNTAFLGLAFDQIRRASAGMPAVTTTLLDTYGMLASDLTRSGLDDRLPPVREIARLTLAGAIADEPIDEDRRRLQAHAKKLGLVAPL